MAKAKNLAANSDQVNSAIGRAMGYIVGRQCMDGGFCFYREEYIEESNLADTFHALAALQLGKAAVPRKERVQRFLLDSAPTTLTSLFFAIIGLALVGQSIPQEWGKQIASRSPQKPEADSAEFVSSWLEETARLAELQPMSARRGPMWEAVRLSDLERDGGYGRHPNLWDTWQALRIMALLGRAPDAATRDFVDDLQDEDMGFRTAPHAGATNVDAILAGLKCCEALNLPWRYPHAILDFTLSCQARDGSFGRRPVALPDLEQTHRAVSALGCLGELT